MKHIKKLLCAFLTLLILVSTITVVVANDDIKVKIDGQQVSFDVPPQLINNRTMVPLRAIFEALGASVEWDGETQTVTSKKDETTISLTIGNNLMYVNDKSLTLDSPACIVEGRTLVPVRAIAEALNTDVQWNDDTKTVIITSLDDINIGIKVGNGFSIWGDAFEAEFETTIELLIVCTENYYQVDNKHFTWESSDPLLATVDNGLVKINKTSGSVTIKATSPSGAVSEQRIDIGKIDALYDKILKDFSFKIGDDGGSATYKGKLKIKDFVSEFEYGSSNWNKATMQIMEEYVAKNKHFSGLMFYYEPNGKGFLGNILYDCYNTQRNDGYSEWWESSKKIIDNYR